MKTTKRSKMLISSIAMLLVALVALGSATYAWYSINRSVEATGISVKAAAVGGLEIKSTDATPNDWTSSPIAWSVADFVLDPAYIEAVASDGSATTKTYTHTGGTNVAASDTPTASFVNGVAGYNYALTKIVSVRNTDKTAMTVTPTITWTSKPDTSFYGAALYKINANGTTTKVLEVASAGSSDNELAYTDTVSLANNAEQSYVFVIYADGMNSNCTAQNGNTNNATASAVKVSFAGV